MGVKVNLRGGEEFSVDLHKAKHTHFQLAKGVNLGVYPSPLSIFCDPISPPPSMYKFPPEVLLRCTAHKHCPCKGQH